MFFDYFYRNGQALDVTTAIIILSCLAVALIGIGILCHIQNKKEKGSK